MGGGFILVRGHLAEDIFHRTGTSVLTHLLRDTNLLSRKNALLFVLVTKEVCISGKWGVKAMQ